VILEVLSNLNDATIFFNSEYKAVPARRHFYYPLLGLPADGCSLRVPSAASKTGTNQTTPHAPYAGERGAGQPQFGPVGTLRRPASRGSLETVPESAGRGGHTRRTRDRGVPAAAGPRMLRAGSGARPRRALPAHRGGLRCRFIPGERDERPINDRGGQRDGEQRFGARRAAAAERALQPLPAACASVRGAPEGEQKTTR